MPDNFTLLAFRPDTILKPCPIQGTRVELTDEEKSAMGLDPVVFSKLKVHAIHNHKTFDRSFDFFLKDDSFYKLSMAADEGTEVRKYN